MLTLKEEEKNQFGQSGIKSNIEYLLARQIASSSSTDVCDGAKYCSTSLFD